jgi:hypothetical protein
VLHGHCTHCLTGWQLHSKALQQLGCSEAQLLTYSHFCDRKFAAYTASHLCDHPVQTT